MRAVTSLALLLAMPACGTSRASPSEQAIASATRPASTGSPADEAQAPLRATTICAAFEHRDVAAGECTPVCPPGEVYIPATGPEGFTMGRGFTMGTTGLRGKGHRPNSDGPHNVVLTKPFCMDETEVTVAAYKACVDAGGCVPPKIFEVRANYPKKFDHPVNEVAWPKAKTFCEVAGKSLPTEAQWEWAATGGDGRRWPWGDDPAPTCEYADFTPGVLVSPGGNSGCHGGGSSPVRSHPKGSKVWPSGALYDLAGNVWEWCLDTYETYPAGNVVDPLAANPAVFSHVVRGGGWNRPARGIQSAFRGAAISTYEVGGLGFRCVRNGIGGG